MLHRPHTPILPVLDECYSGSDHEKSDSGRDDEESDANTDREIVDQLDDLRQSTVDQQISTISVNLKVSRELLQQANRRLDMVENYHQPVHRGGNQPVHIGENQLDSVTGLRDAPNFSYDETSSFSSFSLSSADLCGVSAAVGPQSHCYSLLPHRGDHWTENLVVQLLSGDFELLSQEELCLWLSLYPTEQQSEQNRPLPTLFLEGADQRSEELSQYVSAVDGSIFNILPERKQQGFNSFQPPPFSVDTLCSPETFITACLQDNTVPHSYAIHSAEEEEHRGEQKEEGAIAGWSELEQEEEKRSSHSLSQEHMEEEEEDGEEEEQEEEDGEEEDATSLSQSQEGMENEEEGKEEALQTVKESTERKVDMEEQYEEEEHVEEYSDEKHVTEGSDEEERIEASRDEEERVEEGNDEEERVEEGSDEEEHVEEGSDEEEHVEEGSDEKRVTEGSNEEERVEASRDEEERVEKEGGLSDPQGGGAGSLCDSQEKKHLTDSQHSVLNDTNRAHSTLDNILQEFGCEGTRESPGPDVRTLTTVRAEWPVHDPNPSEEMFCCLICYSDICSSVF
uniref:uncharacterized protein n=1 Tax=Semicossyphus pulcher TaxID=241346 RepID=UPI0037E950DD